MNNTTNSTNSNSSNNTNPESGSVRNHRSMRMLVAIGALAVIALTACNASQRRALGEMDIHDSLASHLTRAVSDRSLSVREPLDCTSQIHPDSHVSASCVGTASSGQAIAATYLGTADVDAEQCTAVLVVDIDSNRVVDQPFVQCFDSA
jgi:hypothetical protein